MDQTDRSQAAASLNPVDHAAMLAVRIDALEKRCGRLKLACWALAASVAVMAAVSAFRPGGQRFTGILTADKIVTTQLHVADASRSGAVISLQHQTEGGSTSPYIFMSGGEGQPSTVLGLDGVSRFDGKDNRISGPGPSRP